MQVEDLETRGKQSFEKGLKKHGQAEALRLLEEEFYRKVNYVISNKITPIYNTVILIFAAVFAYFVLTEENQCYARDQNAWAIQYSNTEDVTRQWYLLSCAGITLLVVSALLYHLQRNGEMFDLLRPYVIIVNLTTLIWFVSLQFYRFKDTGRACAGEFLNPAKYPGNFGSLYLATQASWLKYYVAAHYVVYIVQKMISIIITNRLEAAYEQKRLAILNRV